MFEEVLTRLGIEPANCGAFHGEWTCPVSAGDEPVSSMNPANETVLGRVGTTPRGVYDASIEASQRAFQQWRREPAPVRGELVRRIGNALRHHKDDLGLLVTQIGRAHV